MLLERDRALADLDAVLAATRDGTGGLVIIEGPAGAGKTSLIRAATVPAEDAGFGVLRATGDALEITHVFGIVHQLFDRLLVTPSDGPRDDLFDGHASIVRSLFSGVIGGDSAPREEASDHLRSGAVQHGLYWLLAHLADRAPMVLAVDDLQWGDPSSLTWLLYLARRVEQLPVAMIIGMRPAPADVAAGPLRRIGALEGATRIEPAPLSLDAVAQIIRRRDPDATNDVCRSAWEASGGNPFLAGIAAETLHPGDGSPRSVAPAELLVSVEARLAELPPLAASLAQVLAVWGSPVALNDAAAVAAIPLAAAGDAAGALAAGGWLEDAPQLTLRHPLVRDAVCHLATRSELDDLHRRAMNHLLKTGRPVEEAANHAAATLPNGSAEVVDVLLRAARNASDTAGPADAAALLRRALDEPPAPADRPTVLAMLARAAANAGSPDAGELYERAIADAGELRTRQHLRSRYARLLVNAQRSDRAIAVLGEAIDEDDGADPAMSTELICGRLVALRMDPGHRADWDREARRLDERDLVGDVPAARALKAELSYRNGVAGTGLEDARRWLDDAIGGLDGHLLAVTNPQAFATAMHAALQVNAFTLGLDVSHRALEHARTAGYRSTYLLATSYAAMFSLRCGEPRTALSEVASREDLERGAPVLVPLNAGTAAAAYTALGLLNEAEVELGWLGEGSRFDRELTSGGCVEALGWLRLAQDRPKEALAAFRLMGDGAPTLKGANPSTNLWRSGAARAALRLGESGLATALSDEELGLARTWGAPRPLGVSVTTAAMVAADRRGARQAAELLDEAVAVLETGADPQPLVTAIAERSRRHAAAGRTGDARRDGRRALDLAHRHELRLAADEIVAALRSSGARPRSRALQGIDSLTPAELRVVRAVALTGRSNGEIAADLFVSRKAIEYHLSNAYRKLGVTGRADLATVFAADGGGAPGAGLSRRLG